ncbi:glycosyltransferase family 2 protein [Poriferisphaera sp. WC338]|uniref:glycosyltransferase family 2 protein n=1 Tax=Poriferisphaera sp. WC338 TaxID=3425129 RepID=UPI003D81ADBD
MKASISVLVPVKNEEKNLPDCLRSLDWVDEIFVVDSHSKDRTCEIATQMGAEVVQFDYDGGWPKKKNWSIKNLPFKHDWILIVDADERISPKLKNDILAAIVSDTYQGYYIRWKFIFLDKWMKHCWSHGWMLRLFKKDLAEYEDLGMRGEGGWDNEVHENIKLDGESACLPGYMIHETNVSIERWLDKQNQFSTWNAKRRLEQLNEPIPSLKWFFSRNPLKRRRFLKALYIRMPLQPLIQFVYFYIIKFGFLDGLPGLYFCAFRAAHELNARIKIYEKKHLNSQEGKD